MQDLATHPRPMKWNLLSHRGGGVEAGGSGREGGPWERKASVMGRDAPSRRLFISHTQKGGMLIDKEKKRGHQ